MLNPDDTIAVIGLAARVPGAEDVEAFWQNLVQGRESIVQAPDEELRDRGVTNAELADPRYVRAVSLAADIDKFDAAFFRMTPRDARLTDPQIRMFLEIAHAALENAGYDPTTLPRRVGVFASGGASEYAETHLRTRPEIVESARLTINPLNRTDYIATTTSYRLNLRGPSFTVLTACSSTLVAVHLAVRSLQSGECDMAVVGGADVEFPFGHGYVWLEGGVKARDGHCRPFDKDATGTIFGSGAAAVVLRRLGDAEANRDHVNAVIRATALNNDGADKVSFGAPSMSGQVAVITEAMALADVDPADISYVEAHGTGTALGDPIELAALAEAYARLHGGPLPPGSCAVGSVKGNVGHLGSVAGIAGFVKTVLALDRGQIPPSVNYSAPNPRLELGSTPFAVNDRVRDWPRVPGAPRRAALSSFGIGGSNVHAVIEEAPPRSYPPADGEPRIVAWSALTPVATDEARQRLLRFFTGCPEERFADAAATLQHGRTPHAVRAAVVAASAAEAATALAKAEPVRPAGPPRPVTLLFPGQGSQAVRMAAGLYGRIGAFTAAFDGCLDLFAAGGLDLRGCWQGGPGQPDVNDTRYTQPLLFSVEYATAAMWAAVGVHPAAVLGHSIGELVAATVAGVFELSDAVPVVAARARAIDAAPPGAMLAVAATPQTVADLVQAPVVLAAVNGDRQIVLSGPAPELASCAETLTARGIANRPVPVSRSFHHPVLADAAAVLANALGGVPLRPPRVPLYSAATGALLDAAEATSPRFWADQIVRPVRFAAAADALVAAGPTLLIEAGPGQVLTALMKRHPRVRAGTSAVLSTLPGSTGSETADRAAALRAAAGAWTEGYVLDWTELGQSTPTWRVPVPGYPYQRERHWIDAPVAAGAARGGTPRPPAAVPEIPDAAPGIPEAEAEAVTPFSTIVWAQATDGARPTARRGGHALVLLPRDAPAAMRVVSALGLAGMRSVRVRPGSTFTAGDEFTVRPGVSDDIDRVLADLSARGVRPDLVVHAVAAEPWAPVDSDSVQEQLDASFFSLLSLVQRSVRAGAGQRLPEVAVLATGSADVSGADAIEPVKATLHGFVRTLARETPWLGCRLIDFSASTAPEDLADEVCRRGDLVVALRGRRRWVPTEVPWPCAASTAPAIRSRGVYVLTGGLGGIGLEVAKTLAATGLRPRIALLGRHVPADGGDPGANASAPVAGRAAEVAAAVGTVRTLGAEVRMIACDVADKRQLKRAFDVVTGVFGQIAGVFHLAGVAGDGMLEVRDPARAGEVLRPKVAGTYALAEVVRAHDGIDFVVVTSSRAAVDGLVGSGDYAAANAVLDLAVADTGLFGTRALSVGFPSWGRVGMAARATTTRDGATPVRPAGAAAPAAAPHPGDTAVVTWSTVLSQESAWALDEHRLAGRPLLPGTGHLDMVLRAYRDAVPADGAVGATLLTDVAFAAPLTAVTARDVTVEFTADGTRHRFAVLSRPTSGAGGGEPTRHVTGRIERCDVPGRQVDLAAIRAGTSAIDLPDMDTPHRMFQLGPRWRCVRALCGSGTERLVDLALPAAYERDLADHPLHPALLDCATGAARDSGDPPHVPFIYRRLLVHRDLPAQVHAHVRGRPAAVGLIVADIDIADPDGHVVVEVEGFTMRLVDPASFAPATRETARAGLPAAAAGTTAPAVPAQAVDDIGIPPETGCDLLLALLAAHTPEHVLVRPFRAGRPVPLPAGATTPATAGTAGSEPAQRRPDQPAQPAPLTVDGGHPATVGEGGSTADRLRRLWTETLGLDSIGAGDDFFDLGGSSLTAVELMSSIRDTFGVELGIGLLFDAPTIRELTALVDQASEAR